MTLPPHLKPINEKEDIKVPVEIAAQRELSPDNLNQAFAAVGMARINADQARALRDLGIQARHLGILETMQGTVLIGQQSLVQAIAEITNKISEVSDEASDKSLTPTQRTLKNKELIELAKALGYLNGQLSKVNVSAVKSETVHVENRISQDKGRRMSFPAGRAVGPVIDVK